MDILYSSRFRMRVIGRCAMTARKYAHKTYGSVGSTDVLYRPFNDGECVTYVTRIGHSNQKWSYNSNCCICYVSFDANMLQMLKK